MMGTFNCCYETPCGWCSKWDKKCDKRIGTGSEVKYLGIFDMPNDKKVTKDIKNDKGIKPIKSNNRCEYDNTN